MTLDGFLTFLGLIAAIFAIVPTVTRLKFRVVSRHLGFWSVLFTATILYLQFFDAVAFNCPNFLRDWCPAMSKSGRLTPAQLSFVVVFIWLLLFARAFWRLRVTPGSLPILVETVGRLNERREYSDLIDLIEGDIRLIADCAEGKLPYQKRRARLSGAPKVFVLPIRLTDEVPDAEAFPVLRWHHRFGRFSAQFWADLKRDYVKTLPSDEHRKNAASEIIDTLFRNRRLIEFVAENRPTFGANLLGIEARGAGDFSDHFLEHLISKSDSALYREIFDNQNLQRCGYVIPSRNAILYSLFSDATVAERLAPYQPTGAFALARLNPVNDTAYCASLNLARDRHWDDKGKWRDPTFVSIRFFDIMIHAAACQGIIWHMWLYYIPSVIKSLEEIFEPFDGDARPYGEYPTRAGDLIYACVDALRSWILVASDVDETSPHKAPEHDRVDHENGNIPKSAALALGIAMRTIVMSERIDNDVKKSLLDVSVRAFRELSKEGGAGLLRSSVIKSIAAGGPAGGGPIYKQKLENLYGQIERPWQFDLADFEEEIGFERWHPAGALDN